MFIQVIQGRVSDAGALRAAMDRWQEEIAPLAIGFLGSTAGVTADGRFITLARFSSEQEAMSNSDRPEQDKWWAETSSLFDGEVTFRNSSEVRVDLTGDPDTAGFVQVIQGRSKDPQRAAELLSTHSDEWDAFRPDVLGSVSVAHEDGYYTMAVYFTSEAEARKNEQKELPPELQADMEEMAALTEGEPEYFDLTTPWLYSR